jgi:hypothetical protein
MLPNAQHSDKWRLIFSNLPGFQPEDLSNSLNMDLFENYLKSFTFPGLSVELLNSSYMNYEVRHPISKINSSLSDVVLTMKCSEDLTNYYYIYNWLLKLRNQKNIGDRELFRYNYISEMKLIFLDNQKREKVKHIFTNCFITNIGSLSLGFGSTDELSFDINISFEDYSLDLVTECK